ncbi:protein shisa-5-like [Centropristis striata]|uniref:protein shisa-5-like n=1 Tax=Centropristis striata TaxID=184440 RepID=UPI0027DF7FC8|nr:protein shisa-5-like [Centropristis striata]
MVSRVSPSLVCVLCVILLPAVWADYCASYRDKNGYTHDAVQCHPYFCCGDCTNRQCCNQKTYYISQAQQEHCSGRGGSEKKSRLATLLGSILGSIFPILLCVGLVICCVAPCCLFYKKCRKGRGRAAPENAIYNVPQPPHNPQPHPSGYPSSHPGYQPVPAQPGFGGLPFPQAPPSYGDPNNPPVAYPMFPLPGRQYAEPPPKADEEAPLPYNPAYPELTGM